MGVASIIRYGPHNTDPDPFAVTPRPWITQSLPPAAATQRTTLEPRDVTLNESAIGKDVHVILGPWKVGSNWIYWRSFANFTLRAAVASIGEAPIKGAQPIMNGTPLAFATGDPSSAGGALYLDDTGQVKVWIFDGSQTTQEHASGIHVLDPAYDNLDDMDPYHTARAVILVTWDRDRMNQFPTFEFDTEGYRLCLDPRDGTRKYTENSALIDREVLTNPTWGYGVPSTPFYVNDHLTELGGYGRAADDCDLHIFPPAPTTPPGVTNVGAGAVPVGTWYWSWTAVNADGIETTESPLAGLAVGSVSTIRVVPGVGGATCASRRIYRTLLTATPTATRYFVGEIADNAGGSHLDDSISAATLAGRGAAPLDAPQPERYRMGMLIDGSASSAQDILDTIRAHCMGHRSFDELGRWCFRIDQRLPDDYVPPVVSTIYDEARGLHPNFDAGQMVISRKQGTGRFNALEIEFLDRANGWAIASVYDRRQSVKDGLEREVRATYQLHGLQTRSRALLLHHQMLNREWDDFLVSGVGDRSLMALQPWDVFRLVDEDLEQDMRVLAIATEGEGFHLDAEEYQAASYSNRISSEDSTVGGIFPSEREPPPDPSECKAEPFTPEGPDGLRTVKIAVSWTPANTPFFRSTLVKMNDGIQTRVVCDQPTGPVIVDSPRPGVAHVFTFYTVTQRGLSVGTVITCTPELGGSIVPDAVSIDLPSRSEVDRGTIRVNLPDYGFGRRIEVYDATRDLADPAFAVSVDWTHGNAPINIRHFIHGDGFTKPMSLSVVVKLVGLNGIRSVGKPATWTLPVTGEAIYTIGSNPREVVIDPDTDELYVTCKGPDGVDIIQRISMATGQVTDVITVGAETFGLTIGKWSGGKYLASASATDQSFYWSVLPTPGDGSALSYQVPGLDGLSSFIVFDGSRLWISCFYDDEVFIFDGHPNLSDPDSSFTYRWTVGAIGNSPCKLLAFDGKIWVTNSGSGTVSVIVWDDTTQQANALATIHVGLKPFGICDGGGFVWVTNYGGDSISKIDPATFQVVQIIEFGKGSGPTGVAYGNGELWVALTQARQVARVNVNLGKVTGYNRLDSSPKAVAFDGRRFWAPTNLNGKSATVPVDVVTPGPGGGTSASLPFGMVGLDMSPFPG